MKTAIRSHRVRSVLLVAALLVLPAAVARAQQVDDAASQLSAANNRFGFNLFAELRKTESEKNVLISPASVAMAFAMAYNGAAGDTQRAMAAALQIQRYTLDELNKANAALLKSLTTADPKVQLAIANSLWARQGVGFKDDFLKRNTDFLGASVSELNFDDPNASAIINGWCAKHTKDKIKKIVADRIDPDTVLYLINAIYFKGEWTAKFNKAMTKELPFTLADGKPKQHPLMFQAGKFGYFQTNEFQAVSIPFGGGRMSFYVFLPSQQSDLNAFCRRLTAENWDKWMQQFQTRDGDLWLPRFKLEYETSLVAPLQALGMSIAFQPHRADFSAMRSPPPNLFISEAKHKTFVEVNEEGAEAAAVTSIGISVTSVQIPPPRFSMKVDRPFVCAIRDNQTGAILFLGAIVEPK
jgi:serpin B